MFNKIAENRNDVSEDFQSLNLITRVFNFFRSAGYLVIVSFTVRKTTRISPGYHRILNWR